MSEPPPTPPAPHPFPLTDRQREAVDHDDGPLIILAGPGTGKTRVITERVSTMVNKRRVDPSSVLAVTFTNKAAGELRHRLGESVGAARAQKIHATTFHSFGLGILRRFGDVLGLPSNPILIDSAQRRQLMRELIRGQGLYTFAMGAGINSAIEHAQSTIAMLRNAGIDATRAHRWASGELDQLGQRDDQESVARRTEIERFDEAAKLFAHFERECLARGWMVFEDLIAWPTRLMRTNQNITAVIRQNHQHLVVDEFQDVNAAQIALLEAICPPTSNPDLCVVGDDDQSIYAFRGADDRAFARFDTIWSNTRTITLDDNFRSEPPVVSASNTIITNAPDGSRFAPGKAANPHKEDSGGSTIELVRLEHDEQAGEAIAAMILAARVQDPALDLGSLAVIARTTLELERIARVLDLGGIPIAVRDRTALMDDLGVQDVLAWARLVVDPVSTPDARRILTRPPMRCDPHQIGALISRWRGEHARSIADPTEHPDPGAVLPWLESRCTDATGVAVSRARRLCDELASIDTESTAGDTLLEIVKRTGVIHADLPGPRAHTQRINAVVGLLGFARSRAPRLDQPADLGALLRYIDDLDPSEKSLAQLPESSVEENDDPGNEDGAGRVQLLTAHASKGLEFDTVFIPRVSSPHGYPKMGGADREELPEGLVDRVGDDRDSKQRRGDEERRVFYVALTRAKRRAVLLGKVPKSSRAVNFALELIASSETSVGEHDVRTITEHADSNDAIARLGADFKSRKNIREGFDTLRRTARIRAAESLDRADMHGGDPAQIEQALMHSARTIALASSIEHNAALPQWAEACGLGELGNELIESLEQSEPIVQSSHPGIAGPLRLSYTRIQTYLSCPRCYLVKYIHKLPDDEHAASTTGSAVHEALEKFYTQWREGDAEGHDIPGVEALESLTRSAFLRLWPAHIEPDSNRLEQAVAQARIVWEHLHDDAAQILELEKEITVPFEHAGSTHQIKAKIDRIDHRLGGGYRVIDYKTGYPKKELLEPKKTDLQMGIYALALQELFGGDIAGSDFEYWLLQDGTRGRVGVDDLDTEKIRAKIEAVIGGIQNGDWSRGSKCRGDCEILDLCPDFGSPEGQSAASSDEDTGTH